MQFSKCCPTQARSELRLAFIYLDPSLTARTGTTDPDLVGLFKEQIACLNFPEDFHSYDGTTGEFSAAARWSCCAAFSSLIVGHWGVYYAWNRDAALLFPSSNVSLFSFFQSCVLKPAWNEQQMRRPRINSLKSSTLNKMRFGLINADMISHSIYSLQQLEEFP